ncbi:DUF6491 family protein [Alteromonadaceae bacterium BrNp21-10]|nr:DUF6491 family protein [Alteromonadaceae bacterium BrNp21-10]
MKNLIFAVVTIVLSACSSTSDYSEIKDLNGAEAPYTDYVQSQELMELENVEDFILWDYMILDNQHVTLSERNKKSYMVELEESCKNMVFAKRIGIYQREKEVLNKGDQIIRVGNENEGCFITRIYKLNRVQLEQLSHMNVSRRSNTSINSPERF